MRLLVQAGLPSSRTSRPSTGKVSTVMCVNDTRDSELHHVSKIQQISREVEASIGSKRGHAKRGRTSRKALKD
jgi:uncharacterized membrane protein YjjP (DUF1212 family)